MNPDANKTTLIFSNIDRNTELIEFLSENQFNFEVIEISDENSEKNFKIKMGNDLLSYSRPLLIFNVYTKDFAYNNINEVQHLEDYGLQIFINTIGANFDDVKLVGSTDSVYDFTILKILGPDAVEIANHIQTNNIKLPITSNVNASVTTIL